MSVVEKAASPLDALARKKKKKEKQKQKPARDNALMLTPQPFSIDFERLETFGHFNPNQLSSPLAMELRAVKRRLLRRLGFLRASGDRQAFRMPGRQRNVVLVTSTQAGEGKTFCAVNLAMSLALEDQVDTVLIDADVPRPKVRARFELEKAPGLTDCLLDATPWTSVARTAKEGPLTVLGEGRSIDRSAELFASEACRRLITEISGAKNEGLVLIDAPPALAMTDAVVLAKYVDEVVFVVEANETPEPAIAAALDELLDVNPNVSLILNRCLIGATGSSYSSYDYYGRGEKEDVSMPAEGGKSNETP